MIASVTARRRDLRSAVRVIDTRQNVRLAILLEMLEDVSRATEPEQAVQAYAARIGRLRPVDAVLAVSVRNLPPGTYKITRRIVPDPEVPGGTRHHIVNPWKLWPQLPVQTGGFIGELISTPEPRLVHDLFLRNDPVLGDLLAEMGSCLAIPVFDGGRVLNWTLQFRRDPRGFSVEDLEQNVLTGNLFGAMTRNLVSIEQIRGLNQRLRQQFEEVARVQRALLPRRLPETPGLRIATSYLPSEQAGGDYYDFFELPDGQLGIMIADVAGHGPAAATVMAMLHAVIHAFPGDPISARPSDLLLHANRQLIAAGIEGTFATAVVMRYDPVTRMLTFANAGHPPPRLLVRADGGGGGEATAGPVLPLPGEAALPIGIVEQPEIPECRVRLERGQGLVLYTDGVTEAFNERREMWGIEGLDAALAQSAPSIDPEGLIRAIQAAVTGHTGSPAREDDQTLVVIAVDPGERP